MTLSAEAEGTHPSLFAAAVSAESGETHEIVVDKNSLVNAEGIDVNPGARCSVRRRCRCKSPTP